VISQKEAAERDRELAPDADPSRKKREGGGEDGSTPVSSNERSMSAPPFPKLGCQGIGAGILLAPKMATQGGRRALLRSSATSS